MHRFGPPSPIFFIVMARSADLLPAQPNPVLSGFGAAERAQHFLRRAAIGWVMVALFGQLLFSLYVTLVYGGAVVTGDTERWNHVMPRGYVPGDTAGNAALMSHVLIAVLIMLGGGLQLLPAIRRRLPALHRWVGRVYMISVMLASLAGLYLTWTRGEPSRMPQHIAISLNAIIMRRVRVAGGPGTQFLGTSAMGTAYLLGRGRRVLLPAGRILLAADQSRARRLRPRNVQWAVPYGAGIWCVRIRTADGSARLLCRAAGGRRVGASRDGGGAGVALISEHGWCRECNHDAMVAGHPLSAYGRRPIVAMVRTEHQPNLVSQAVHEALGFVETERVVYYRKLLD